MKLDGSGKEFMYNDTLKNRVRVYTKGLSGGSVKSTDNENNDLTNIYHVYKNYNCEIIKRQDESVMLKYLDNSNIFQFIPII